MKYFTVLLSLILIACSSCVLKPVHKNQNMFGEVSGIITDSVTNLPIYEAKIYWTYPPGFTDYITKSDSNGVYSAPAVRTDFIYDKRVIDMGIYQELTIDAVGYEILTVPFTFYTIPIKLVDKNITLVPLSKKTVDLIKKQ